MQAFKINRVFLVVSYDAIERGYFVKGMGFDFFAILVTVDGISYIECREVSRYENGNQFHLIIPMHQAKQFSCDLLETLIIAKLSENWDL